MGKGKHGLKTKGDGNLGKSLNKAANRGKRGARSREATTEKEFHALVSKVTHVLSARLSRYLRSPLSMLRKVEDGKRD